MRRFFVLILIALLPLHGLATSSMGVEMATQVLVVTDDSVSTQSLAAHAVDPTDLESASANAPSMPCHVISSDSSPQTQTVAASCAACAACHTLALNALTFEAADVGEQSGVPLASSNADTSTHSRVPAKPPKPS